MTMREPQLIAAVFAADDLHIARSLADRVTTGTPTWIWSVVIDDRLFVRAYNALPPAGLGPL
jgi:hypothetical protein